MHTVIRAGSDQFNITLDDKIVAELRLNVYLGGLSVADYVWIDQHQSDDIRLMAAMLATYIAIYQIPECEGSPAA